MTPKFAIACALVALTAASNATVLYQTSFEAPTFSTGDIYQQDSWTDTATVTTAVIDNSDARTGTQSVLIDSSQSSGQYWTWRPINFLPGSQTVITSVWIKPISTTSPTSTFGFLSYDSVGSLIGGMTFNGPSVAVVDTNGTSINTNGVMRADTWNQVTSAYNFGSKVMTVSLNGNVLGSSSFTESTFGDADFYMNATGFDTVRFDDLSIEAVPEPATIAALGIGLAAIGRRRRK